MSDTDGIAQVGKPVQVEWNNRRVRARENTHGEMFYILELEVKEDAWGFLKTIPRNADGEMVIWVTNVGLIPEKPKKEKEPKPSKGPYGALWRELKLSGFVNIPGVREAIEEERKNELEEPWVILRRVLGVESMATVSVDEIYAKFPPNEWPTVKTMVEQAQRKAEANSK